MTISVIITEPRTLIAVGTLLLPFSWRDQAAAAAALPRRFVRRRHLQSFCCYYCNRAYLLFFVLMFVISSSSVAGTKSHQASRQRLLSFWRHLASHNYTTTAKILKHCYLPSPNYLSSTNSSSAFAAATRLLTTSTKTSSRQLHNINDEEADTPISTIKNKKERSDLISQSRGGATNENPEEESIQYPTPRRLQRWRKSTQRGAADMISGIGFMTSSLTSLWSDIRQYRKWKPTITALENFLNTTGIDNEIKSSINYKVWDYAIILGQAQKASLKGNDIRDLALARGIARSKLPSKEECIRYMKYATAAYGEAMIRAAEMNVKGTFDTRLSPLTRTRVSEHIGIPEEDLVLLDVEYDGNPHHLRHFVAIDHNNKKVVLAIRGTFSLAELVVDIAGFSRPFCGGEAHSEMANMAERVWEVSGTTVRRLLKENADYEFIITGHSLGAGTACLLNILCHNNNRKLVDGHRKVRCFAYAAPPTFTPLDLVPGAVNHCANFIHQRDVIPFLSVNSVRHILHKIRAIDKLQHIRSWKKRLAHVTGYLEPDKALIQAATGKSSHGKQLQTKAGAPNLVVPAGVNFWLWKKEDEGDGSDSTFGGLYDIKVCDSRRLADEVGIQIDLNMLQDHFPPRYEHALDNLE